MSRVNKCAAGKSAFADGFASALPVCLGLIPIGISYGLLAMQAGLGRLETVLMSVLVMAGSSQLMVVGMIGKAAVFTMVTAVFFVNLRHLVMSSAAMSRMEPTSLGKRLLCAFALCDESFALFSMSGSRSADKLLGANTALYGTWVAASVLGVAIGQFLPANLAKSFGVAFYAAFLSLLLPNVRRSRSAAALVLLTAVLNTGLQLVIPASWAVILSMVLGAAIGTFFAEDGKNEQK